MPSSRILYEFEGFRLDPRNQSLLSTVDGQQLALKPKEFDALLYFVQHAGELIAKETLLSALWPAQVVEENNLNQYVTALRKLLGEERGGRRFIMNVRARGYRFVPQVLQLQAETGIANHAGKSSKAPTENLVAWQCYQQAVHRQNADQPENWCEAVGLFERAIALDPTFASAYAYLALTRIRLYMIDHPSAIGAIDKAFLEAKLAVELRPGMADGHMALGAINAAGGRWVEAEFNYLAARELDREWVMPAAMHAAHVLLSTGHLQKALELGRFTLRDLNGVTSLAALHTVLCVMTNENTEATQVLDMTIAMGADLRQSPLSDVKAMLARRRGQFDEAAQALIATLSPYLLAAGTADIIEAVFAAIADPSQRQQAALRLDQWVAQLDMDQVPHTLRRQILLWYTEIGALDGAFALVHQAIDRYQRYNIVGTAWGCIWLPEMAPFRRDPRFTGFAHRVRMPDYWQAFGPPDGHVWRNNCLIEL
ncbi:MAG: winged helix-turn-helix domain-containing protein [Pseudomonadota bacterium]